ncbi:hypothetical protein [Ferruginibacter sp. SUN106]|uniref:hypothetical protein n=1 Tax=Ferruginibacter sp. SUN106 TaxID=2978348 RepID=UPI003D35A4F4
MKKSITILILSLLFFSQIGYRFIYLIQQHQLKEQAEEQLLSTVNEDQLEQVNVEDNQDKITWEEEGKEFFLNGQMYDVAKKEIINGKTILYCLNDKKEEQLVEDMLKKEKANADNTSSNKDGKHTIKFQLSDFTEQIQETVFNNKTITAQKFQVYTAPVCTVTKEVNTPPPNNNLYFQKLIL